MCRAAVMLPHAAVKACRRQLAALGWALIRWRRPKRGVVRRWPVILLAGGTYRQRQPRLVKRRDVGGSGKILYLCRRHRTWRPTRGVELPVPRIPRFG